MRRILLLFLLQPSTFGGSAYSSDPSTAPAWLGLRVGSRVERGAEWRYGEQDGGGRGTVVELRRWRGASVPAPLAAAAADGPAPPPQLNASAAPPLIAARVRWDATGGVNAYRWGGAARELSLVGWRPLTAEEAAVPGSTAEALAGEAARAAASGALAGSTLRRLWAAWGGADWRGAARGWWAEGWPACGGGGREPGAAAPRGAWAGLACAPDARTLLGVDLSGGGLRGPLGGGGALEALAELGGLQSLNLARNGLGGAVPPALCALAQLRVLDLSHNALEGELPACLGDLPHLQLLSLAGNPGLTGPLPERWARLRALRALHLHGCERLAGPLPRALADLLAAGVRHVSLPAALRDPAAQALAGGAAAAAEG
jgi:hypothetical protein